MMMTMKRKPAITRTTTILVAVLAAGLASAQSPSIIQNTRSTMNAVSNHAAAASNEALAMQPVSAAVTPEKSVPAFSTRHGRPSGAKHTGWGKRVPGPTARRVAPVVVSAPAPAPAPTPKREAAVVAGVAGSAEGENESEQSVVPDSKYNANGRRDPFISPVVSHAGGSGCSTGKKCLEIGAINLRGVVRSEGGFIAVVSNGLNKAYFLRENDPVFNGYVMKITGDSIVFQETLQDRLGKTFTREVVKKITTPAV
jgi:hypothetical protein